MVENSKFPLPRKYWMYVSFCALLAILLFINIFVTDHLTGEKEFWEFDQKDWYYFAVFLLAEIIVGFLMFFFAVKAGKISTCNQKQVQQYYKRFCYSGIKPGDYDHVWFDYSGDARAIIVKRNDVFFLYIEEFDMKTETWRAANTVSIYNSIEEIKKTLFYECDFYCDANTVLDKYGEEIFKDNHTMQE